MAARIRTASRTTASLSDAKSSKSALRCQSGCSEPVDFAMPRWTSCARTIATSRWIGSERVRAMLQSNQRLRRLKIPSDSGELDPAERGVQSARPRLPAFPDRLGVALHVDVTDAIDAFF